MNKWSNGLIELSKEYLNYSGTCVKSLKGEFGKLEIDYQNNIYSIIIFNSDQTIIFNSINQIINAGWVVD